MMIDELEKQPEVVEAQPEQPEPITTQAKQDADKELNFRYVTEAKERAERELAMLKQQLAAQQSQPDPDDIDGAEDDFLEVGKYKTHNKKVKDELTQTRQELEQMKNQMIYDYIQSKCPNFSEIVTPENEAKLARLKPVLYRNLLASKDRKDQMELLYDSIKENVVEKKVMNNNHQRDREEAKSQPKSAASFRPQAPNSPLSRLDDYDRIRRPSDDEASEIRARVAEIGHRARG